MKVWATDYLFGGYIRVLTTDTLYVKKVPPPELQSTKARIEAGETPQAVLGSDATIIAMGDVTRVAANQHGNKIEVRCSPNGKTLVYQIGFGDSSELQEMFDALRENLGPEFRFQVVEFTRARACLAPLAGALLGAIGLWWYMKYPYEHGVRSGPLIFYIFNMQNFVVAVLGVLVVISLALLIAHLWKPPVMMDLRR